MEHIFKRAVIQLTFVHFYCLHFLQNKDSESEKIPFRFNQVFTHDYQIGFFSKNRHCHLIYLT
jgi:hypothetical protein